MIFQLLEIFVEKVFFTELNWSKTRKQEKVLAHKNQKEFYVDLFHRRYLKTGFIAELMTVAILALSDPAIAAKLVDYRANQANGSETPRDE